MLDLLFPGRSVTFESALSLEDVTQRLQQEIAAPAWPIFDRRTQNFEGSFAGGRFRMRRIIKDRRSVNLMIKGQVSRAAAGTRVDVHLQMRPAVIALLVVFSAIASGIAAIVASEQLAVPGAGEVRAVVVAVAAVVAIVVLCAAVSNVEASKTLTYLSGVVGAPPMQRG
jgi:hypothetical protein